MSSHKRDSKRLRLWRDTWGYRLHKANKRSAKKRSNRQQSNSRRDIKMPESIKRKLESFLDSLDSNEIDSLWQWLDSDANAVYVLISMTASRQSIEPVSASNLEA